MPKIRYKVKKKVITCYGCKFDPTYKQQLEGIVCLSEDQKCQGKVKRTKHECVNMFGDIVHSTVGAKHV